MAPIPSLQQPLSDESVGLRFTAERDIPEILIAYQDDPNLHIQLGKRRPPSGAELGQELEAAATNRAQGVRAGLAVLELPSDQCRGEVTVYEIDWERGQASLGIWVAPGARGRGLARRALTLAAQWLFEACGCKKVGLLTAADNEPLLRAARAAGFVDDRAPSSHHEPTIHGDMAALALRPGDLEFARPTMPAAQSSTPSA
jgi:RimJ/RimL family protein N-acetyltransferase